MRNIRHLQDRIVACTLEARANPCLWPVVEALKATLVALVAARRQEMT